MKTLDQDLLNQFLKQASLSLKGDWVLIGGSLLPLLGIEHRTTTDIDFVSLHPKTHSNEDNLMLMEIAEKLGLPVESMNQTGAYFLSKQKITKRDLVLLKATKNCSIYRPGATLYLLLKIERLSESDLADCLEWLKYTSKQKEALDVKVLKERFKKLEKKENSKEYFKRIATLKVALKMD